MIYTLTKDNIERLLVTVERYNKIKANNLRRTLQGSSEEDLGVVALKVATALALILAPVDKHELQEVYSRHARSLPQ